MTSSSMQQARALITKHAVQQRRAIKTNLCLISAPLVFCLFLWLIQNLVVDLLLKNDKFHCGCQCMKCCGGHPYNCSKMESGYCDSRRGFTCLDYNSSSCGVQFSSADQAVWCAIEKPSSWPPVMRIPPSQYRAAPWAPELAMPYTGLNTSASAAVASRMFPAPRFTLLQLLKLEQLLKQLVDPSGTQINGYILAQLGFQYASTVNPPSSYYVDPAFISGTTTTDTSNYVYVVLPHPGCIEANLTGPLPVRQFLVNYISATSPSLKPVISQLLNASLGNSTASLMVQSINFLCVDAVMDRHDNASHINRDLYCGWKKSRCNGSSTYNSYTAAWDLLDTSGLPGLRVDVDYNLSLPMSSTPKLYRTPGLLNAAVRGWARALPAKVSGRVAGGIELLGLMSFPKGETKLPFDLSSLLGPLFYTWVVQLLMPTFLQQLVYEKENRLRMMMRIHGLGDGAYWCITYLWYMLLYVLYILVFMAFGIAIRLELFVHNSYGIQAILYLIFGNTMIAFCFVLSCFFTSSRTAEAFGYLYVLATGLIGALLVENFMDEDMWYCGLIELVPGFALYRGLYELASYSLFGSYSQRFGLTFDKLHDDGNGMFVAWAIMLGLWPVFMLLAFYLEQVVAAGPGARRSPLYFLNKCWPKKAPGAGSARAIGSSPPPSSNTLLPHGEGPPRKAAAASGSSALASQPPTPHYLAPAPPRLTSSSSATREEAEELEEGRGSSPGGGPLRSSGSGRVQPLSPPCVSVKLLLPEARAGAELGDKEAEADATPRYGTGTPRKAIPFPVAPGSSDTEGGAGPGAGAYPDVEAERQRVLDLLDGEYGASEDGKAKGVAADFPILMHGLAKTFPKFQGGTERHAVRDMSLAVADGECFGLLGPNGAGKTTMLNMLIGFLEPSAGTVHLAGKDIAQELRSVYQIMGVCPQDNLLWGALTAREHLHFFGRLKGLTGAPLTAAVEEALLGVNLHREGDKRVDTFSGGMKRRLSVAISLIGSPRVVFLDEPSTGLDPASRRRLWDVVKKSKPGRGLILTTHSMEEAEVLCDRLGIFVDGQLVCLGNPKEITSRYAGYLVFTITVPQDQEEQARQLVARMSPAATLTYHLSNTLKYELPTSDTSLSAVFRAVNEAKAHMTILDWGVANATLEEVFIKLARGMDKPGRELM